MAQHGEVATGVAPLPIPERSERPDATDGLGGSQLLSLLRLASPSLPIGAYAYSRAVEYAVHAGAIIDEATTEAWVLGLMRHVSVQLDGAIFLRLHRAFAGAQHADVERWNARLLASRESAELRFEDTQLGAALVRWLSAQLPEAAAPWLGREDLCHASAFALACVQLSVPETPALLALLWSQAESQISAAVRLIPLGQTAGQRMLTRTASELPELATQAAAISDGEIGALAPGFAMASALHETQYTRLFRS